MRCSRAEELMSLEIDGQATEAEIEKLQKHVAFCPQCAQRWENLRAVSAFLSKPPMVRPRKALTGPVMLRIEEACLLPVSARQTGVSWRLICLTAIAMLILGNGLLTGMALLLGQTSVGSQFVGVSIDVVWRLTLLLSSLGNTAWELIWVSAHIGQQGLVSLVFCIGLILTAIWAHILLNYRGVQVRQENGG